MNNGGTLATLRGTTAAVSSIGRGTFDEGKAALNCDEVLAGFFDEGE